MRLKFTKVKFMWFVQSHVCRWWSQNWNTEYPMYGLHVILKPWDYLESVHRRKTVASTRACLLWHHQAPVHGRAGLETYISASGWVLHSSWSESERTLNLIVPGTFLLIIFKFDPFFHIPLQFRCKTVYQPPPSFFPSYSQEKIRTFFPSTLFSIYKRLLFLVFPQYFYLISTCSNFIYP